MVQKGSGSTNNITVHYRNPACYSNPPPSPPFSSPHPSPPLPPRPCPPLRPPAKQIVTQFEPVTFLFQHHPNIILLLETNNTMIHTYGSQPIISNNSPFYVFNTPGIPASPPVQCYKKDFPSNIICLFSLTSGILHHLLPTVPLLLPPTVRNPLATIIPPYSPTPLHPPR